MKWTPEAEAAIKELMTQSRQQEVEMWNRVLTSDKPRFNTDPNAFGVIVDNATGELSGYAWGENVGWINFGSNYGAAAAARPAVNLSTGDFTGYAWG